MDVEEYLASPQALEDVAEHFARPHDEHKITTCGWYGRDDTWSSRPVANWPVDQHERDDRNPWGAIRFGSMKVYYRPEGDRFVVTDLGEAVRALRLRVGALVCPWSDCYEQLGTALRSLNGLNEAVWSAGALVRTVPAADLPRAICAVMLAAYRVSRLEVRG